jgi:hypothetical protein
MDRNEINSGSTTVNVRPLVPVEDNAAAFTLRPIRRFSAYPVLLAIVCAAPTTANVRLYLPETSANQTYARSSFLFRRRDEEVGVEAYSPYFAPDWQEMGPLRVPISRMVTAKIQFVGKIRMLPVSGEF